VALCATFIAVVLLVDTHSAFQRDDWRGASRSLGAAAQARAIVATPGSALIPLGVYEPRLEPLTTATVSEIDVVALGEHMTGHGISRPPRPATPLHAPPGFRLVGAKYARTYEVLRFRASASAPARVTAPGLAPYGLGSGPRAVLLQRPR
jgi:hypothetical protein